MGLTAAFAGVQAVGAYRSSQAQKIGMRANATMQDNNAQIAEWQASQALQNGQVQEGGKRLETAALYGRERAALAASGVDLGYGSATDVLTSTKVLGEADAMQIHDNALREAWGYRTQATAYRNQGKLGRSGADSISPLMSGVGSLLGSAASSGFDFSSMGGGSQYNYRGSDLPGSLRGGGG